MNIFSRLYLEPPKSALDSSRARARLGAYCSTLHYSASHRSRELIGRELGIKVGSGYKTVSLERFFDGCDLSDFLSSITLVFHAIGGEQDWSRAFEFHSFVDRLLKEENLPYRIDDEGCIHPLVDQIFEKERQSILVALASTEYIAARSAMDRCFDALKADGSGTLEAVRYCFEANENVFKQNFPEKLLGATEIKRHLEPIVQIKYEGRARDAASRLLAAFKEYVNAMHQYRHADGHPEPTPPPIDLAVFLISQGTSNLRWLLGLVSD